jgi:hypothetical protein
MRNNRFLAAFSGLAICAALAGWSTAQDRTKAEPKEGANANQPYWDCAKACDDCARMCTACGTHCTQMVADGHKNHMETVQTCQDCASICTAAGSVTARSGPFSDTICTACAEACKRCGEACGKHASHDLIMKNCAEECKKCEQACRDMLKHVGHGAERR